MSNFSDYVIIKYDVKRRKLAMRRNEKDLLILHEIKNPRGLPKMNRMWRSYGNQHK